MTLKKIIIYNNFNLNKKTCYFFNVLKILKKKTTLGLDAQFLVDINSQWFIQDLGPGFPVSQLLAAMVGGMMDCLAMFFRRLHSASSDAPSSLFIPQKTKTVSSR